MVKYGIVHMVQMFRWFVPVLIGFTIRAAIDIVVTVKKKKSQNK